ncbi:MAG TPA: aminotransferase class I/II-fold pyridoxal phosphate-dependent enzyme [Candidatus Angelobacter sp.]|nr:aminotransferase class I/II-fold pyridoxal phosphate-dependent enzyme [Candidatus Angelobacter sp.]
MDFHNFELERFQSQFERTVDYNLADSSVECAGVRDLLGDEAAPLLALPLYYPEVNGTGLLRERIAGLYPDAKASNVLVTVGAAQANWMVAATLLGPGDGVITISPGYRQIWGLATNIGCTVKEVRLHPDDNWRLDLDELEDQLQSLASARTKMVAVVNPNNPTGSILSASEMERIVNICEKHGAWLHADEVYRGTEFEGPPTPSFWGTYDKLVCVNSLSKAYGLAGLRIGWAVASPEIVESLWRRHEYAVIAAAGPSMLLAEIALEPRKRQALLDRQKRLSREGHALLQAWVHKQQGAFSVQPPAATSIAFVRCHLPLDSVALAHHIRTRASVLVAPGAYLGTENHLRITVGYNAEKVQTALGRIAGAVAELAELPKSRAKRELPIASSQ